MAQGRRQFRLRFLFRQYTEAILLTVIVAVAVRWVVISPYRVAGDSMGPELQVGDLIFAYKIPFGISLPFFKNKLGPRTLPSRGSLVVVEDRESLHQGGPVIRRVVGLPGDKVEVRQGLVWLNDEPITKMEPKGTLERFQGRAYGVELPSAGAEAANFEPVLVPPGKVFVLPDRRTAEPNAKHHPIVSLDSIEGRPFLIWLSLDWNDRDRALPRIRSERMLRRVH